jgi:hypothetical protein
MAVCLVFHVIILNLLIGLHTLTLEYDFKTSKIFKAVMKSIYKHFITLHLNVT